MRKNLIIELLNKLKTNKELLLEIKLLFGKNSSGLEHLTYLSSAEIEDLLQIRSDGVFIAHLFSFVNKVEIEKHYDLAELFFTVLKLSDRHKSSILLELLQKKEIFNYHHLKELLIMLINCNTITLALLYKILIKPGFINHPEFLDIIEVIVNADNEFSASDAISYLAHAELLSDKSYLNTVKQICLVDCVKLDKLFKDNDINTIIEQMQDMSDIYVNSNTICKIYKKTN